MRYRCTFSTIVDTPAMIVTTVATIEGVTIDSIQKIPVAIMPKLEDADVD
jgi:hypothetical protein